MVTEAVNEKQTLGFQAEVKQLLDLMIHSLYSNKEIFLRELVSNASDAIDKLRFESISNPELYETDHDFKIRVSFDKDARTITISDNGIGMSREEVIENIGTIARSGTREFFQKLTGDQKKDAALIGQFGVGFYSSFIVADKVTLVTRRAGATHDAGVQWESDGAGEYTLETVTKEGRGTDVILHLREGEDELLDSYRLRSIIRKYSDHITLPIVMPTSHTEGEGDEALTTIEDETVNKASALWTRPRNEITDDEYNEFYKNLTYDFGDPLARIHARMEGKYEYTMLLYVPGRAPFDMWQRERQHGIKLYVRRVFIMDDTEKLLPTYLRFVRGVIDSNDLPLNVSRELLQSSKVVETIRSNATKKILDTLDYMATSEKDKYAGFWKEFGNALKEGVSEDPTNQEKIARLLRFASTFTDTEVQDVALEDYLTRMKEGQDKIYYITADTFGAAKNNPLLEIFRQKNIEVLLMHDVVDNWVVNHLLEYKGKKLQSVARGELDLDGIKGSETDTKPEDEAAKPSETELQDLTTRITSSLGEKVKSVRTTNRLVNSPACLVMDERGLDANFLRLLKSAGQKVPDLKPIFEINPQHPLIARLKDAEGQRFDDWVAILFDGAVLSDGGQLEDPANFVTRLNSLLVDMSK
jgi:molecular chaperone HtpG